MINYGKIPPQAIDLEKTVLSALLSDSQAIIEISDILTPEMFYNDEHKNIFEAIQTMFHTTI
jgi:replicative DNA helicase